MRLSFSEDIQASLFKVLTVLRYLIFLSFYILSIPFILFNIDRASIQNPLLLVFPLPAIAILSSWKTLSKELRRLEEENRKLKEALALQSQKLMLLRKERDLV